MGLKTITRAEVEALAADIRGRAAAPTGDDVRAAGEAAVALVVAAGLAKKPCDASVLPDVMAQADDLLHAAAVVGSVTGERAEWLIRASESGRLSTEREAVALLFAVDALPKDGAPPDRLLVQLRLIARRPLGLDAAALIGAAAASVKDEAVRLIAARWIKDAQTLDGKDAVEYIRSMQKSPLLAFSDEPAANVVSGFTMRRAAPKTGRNDPCHCGSGQKYKKCCAAKDEARNAEPSPIAGVTYSEYLANAHEHMKPRELAALKPSEIAGLDADKLSVEQLREVIAELGAWRDWPLAERLLDVLEQKSAKDAETLRLMTAEWALDAGGVDIAKRQLAKLSEQPMDLVIALGLAERAPNVAEKLEAHLAGLLRENRWPPVVELCFTLLRHSPALGILLSRSVALEAHPNDSEELIAEIELARDRLLLAPGDSIVEVYDALVGFETDELASAERAKSEPAGPIAPALSEDVKKHLDEASARIEALQKQLAEKEAALEKSRPERVAVVDEEERRRLRDKVSELKSLLSESHEERSTLRRELQAAARKRDETERRQAVAPRGERKEAVDEGDDDGTEVAAADVRKLALLVPVFTAAAEQGLKTVPRTTAEAALRAAAGLAAGEPADWRGVKLLQRVKGVYSCRVGIHHRLLFELDRDRARLEVVAFVKREDFDTTVRRLASRQNI